MNAEAITSCISAKETIAIASVLPSLQAGFFSRP
jgi:hypothetical protein